MSEWDTGFRAWGIQLEAALNESFFLEWAWGTTFTVKCPEWSKAGLTAVTRWLFGEGATGPCFRQDSALLSSSNTVFPGFWEGFLISGLAGVKPEVCLASVCSLLALAIIRLNQSTSDMRPVTIYFYINKIKSSIQNKDVWRHIRTIGSMYSLGFASNESNYRRVHYETGEWLSVEY